MSWAWYLPILKKLIGVFKEKINVLIEKEKLRIKVADKFNGKIVMANHPNLTGSELREVLLRFKQNYEDFNDYVLKTEKEQIAVDFKKSLNG